jgi:hypothetical protein
VNCFNFPAGIRTQLDEDLAAFYQASDAALAKRAFRREIETTTLRGKTKTIFETVEDNGFSTIRVKRGDTEAHFADTEAAKVKDALREARAGEAWFKKLLTAEKLPVQTASARPPVSTGYYCVSSLGQIECGGFNCEISVRSDFFAKEKRSYKIQYQLQVVDSEGKLKAGFSGQAVDRLFEEISQAMALVEKNKDYASEADDERRYPFSVTAKPESSLVEVVWFPSERFNDRTPNRGQLDRMKLVLIQDLIEAANARQQWLENNEGLFYQPKQND